MAIKPQDIKLNIVPGGIIPVQHATQYDVGRKLTFTIFDGNSPAALPSGTTAKVEGTKPDGHGFQYAATISDNTVTVLTTQQMTAVVGAIDCKITFYNGDVRIGTALYILDVEKAGINENTIISDTDLPLIIEEATEQMERAEAAADAASASEINAKASEDAAALSETHAATSESNAEAWAVGERGGVPVTSEDETFHNNSKYYADNADTSADNAFTSEQNAKASEQNAKQSEEILQYYVDFVIPHFIIQNNRLYISDTARGEFIVANNRLYIKNAA